MNTKILRVGAILTILAAGSGTAWADYNCNVKISLENVSNNTVLFPITSWSKDVPDFRTSGMAKFAYQAYPGWVDFVPFGPVAMDITNAIPSRTQKCMNEAMTRVFSSASATSSIMDEILSSQIDINAKSYYCTQPQVMEPGEGGQMSGRAGFKFKFSAQKILNRNNWRHETITMYPPKSFCASYYKPSCFGQPDEDEFEADVEEFNGEYIEGLFEDQPSTDEQWEDQLENAEEAANSTPPPTEYCVAKPWEPLTLNTIKYSQNGTSSWQLTNRSTTNDISLYIAADFSGEGKDDLFIRQNGTIYSPTPDDSFYQNCMTTTPTPSHGGHIGGLFGFGRPKPSGGPFGNNNFPKHVISCIPAQMRESNIQNYKLAKLDGSKTSIIRPKNGAWQVFDTDTRTWIPRAIPGAKAIKYDPRSGVNSSLPSMPANPNAYFAGLKSAASHAQTLGFGDFFGDGKDDAFVIYDGKWWVSNNLSAPWVVIADFNLIRPQGLLSVSDSKAELKHLPNEPSVQLEQKTKLKAPTSGVKVKSAGVQTRTSALTQKAVPVTRQQKPKMSVQKPATSQVATGKRPSLKSGPATFSKGATLQTGSLSAVNTHI
ncbi:MAG TPA: hypothetical protein ENJ42_00905, partial [Hellea balneolensis]|nr:hypothetical protein [Hellea balneolensis]